MSTESTREPLEALREALKKAFLLPRPWIDGSVEWKTWNDAFEEIEQALAASTEPASTPAPKENDEISTD